MTQRYYTNCAEAFDRNPTPSHKVDRLARAAKDGDRGALERLGREVASMAERVSGKFVRWGMSKGLSRDDLRQEATVEVLERLETWDPEKSTFRTYAWNTATFAVRDLITGNNTVSGLGRYVGKGQQFNTLSEKSQTAAEVAMQPSLSFAPIKTDDDDERALDPATVETGYEEVIKQMTLGQIFRCAYLQPQHKRAVAARMGFLTGHSLTYREVGEALEVSGERARQLVLEGLNKLRVASMRSAGLRQAS